MGNEFRGMASDVMPEVMRGRENEEDQEQLARLCNEL